jgi:hypothetical protein
MAKTHLCEACKYIPPQLKAQLCGLRRGKKGSTGEGKQYWAYGAKAMVSFILLEFDVSLWTLVLTLFAKGAQRDRKWSKT